MPRQQNQGAPNRIAAGGRSYGSQDLNRSLFIRGFEGFGNGPQPISFTRPDTDVHPYEQPLGGFLWEAHETGRCLSRL